MTGSANHHRAGTIEPMNISEVVSAAQTAGVTLIRFEYCDYSGVARTKAVHISQLASAMTEGLNFTRAQNAINLLEEFQLIDGMEKVGAVRLVPDPDTFTVLPWVPGSASMMGNQLNATLDDDGTCPRLFLTRMIERARVMGFVIDAAFENEFYLARDVDGHYVPFAAPIHSPVYSPIGIDHATPVLLAICTALEAQGMRVESVMNEYGAGQFEVVIRYADALRAADHQMQFRDTVRGVARQHDLLASFAPKPFPEEVGSGAHIHASVWNSDHTRNLLFDANANGSLSTLGRHFIAGVAEHLPALLALTAPSANSHRRLAPQSWTSATTAWGFENKEAALRVIAPFHGREEQSMNIEFKPSDASANPYLSLGAFIACGLDGIARALDPGEPTQHDPATLDANALARGKVRPLPSTMSEALDALEADELLMQVLGDPLNRFYLAMRRSEAARFAAHDVAFEIRHHFHRF